MTSKTITREGVQVRVGQVWRDLDKYARNRELPVTLVFESGYAYLKKANGGNTRIAIRRMHKNSTGWALVLDVPP